MTYRDTCNPITFNMEHMTTSLERDMNACSTKPVEGVVYVDKELVITLMKEGKFKEASEYGDSDFGLLIILNEDIAWNSLSQFKRVNGKGHNGTTYGNLAIAIHHGGKFPERRAAIKRLTRILNK